METVSCVHRRVVFFFLFFNDAATTEFYPLPLHDALPIFCCRRSARTWRSSSSGGGPSGRGTAPGRSEEHTSELQSPYVISYAVFCLKKKKKNANSGAMGDTYT